MSAHAHARARAHACADAHVRAFDPLHAFDHLAFNVRSDFGTLNSGDRPSRQRRVRSHLLCRAEARREARCGRDQGHRARMLLLTANNNN